ncbi:MAG: BrnT family toxin [Microcystaceae cyanobacterium]
MQYHFEWNPTKEKQNLRKHNLNFRQASTVFRDPAQLNLYDEEHSQEEDRWITIGLDETGSLRVIVHTFEQIDKDRCLIRIISARKATLAEQTHYQRRKL